MRQRVVLLIPSMSSTSFSEMNSKFVVVEFVFAIIVFLGEFQLGNAATKRPLFTENEDWDLFRLPRIKFLIYQTVLLVCSGIAFDR